MTPHSFGLMMNALGKNIVKGAVIVGTTTAKSAVAFGKGIAGKALVDDEPVTKPLSKPIRPMDKPMTKQRRRAAC